MFVRIAALAGFAVLGLLAVSPAEALSSHDCSVAYKAAQDAGTLSGMKYADFRKAKCGSDAATATPAATTPAAPAATPPAPKSTPAPAPAPAPATAANDGEPTVTNTEHTAEPGPATAVAPKGVVFPKVVDPKYASESAGKGRMHTCLDQYRLNKTNNALGGLKWIEKGGGYYSLCNTRLKS
jgi:hypothetical protein